MVMFITLTEKQTRTHPEIIKYNYLNSIYIALSVISNSEVI